MSAITGQLNNSTLYRYFTNSEKTLVDNSSIVFKLYYEDSSDGNTAGTYEYYGTKYDGSDADHPLATKDADGNWTLHNGDTVSSTGFYDKKNIQLSGPYGLTVDPTYPLWEDPSKSTRLPSRFMFFYGDINTYYKESLNQPAGNYFYGDQTYSATKDTNGNWVLHNGSVISSTGYYRDASIFNNNETNTTNKETIMALTNGLQIPLSANGFNYYREENGGGVFSLYVAAGIGVTGSMPSGNKVIAAAGEYWMDGEWRQATLDSENNWVLYNGDKLVLNADGSVATYTIAPQAIEVLMDALEAPTLKFSDAEGVTKLVRLLTSVDADSSQIKVDIVGGKATLSLGDQILGDITANQETISTLQTNFSNVQTTIDGLSQELTTSKANVGKLVLTDVVDYTDLEPSSPGETTFQMVKNIPSYSNYA